MVAEPSWIILCESFHSSKLLEVDPVGRTFMSISQNQQSKQYVIHQTSAFRETGAFKIITQAQKAPCRQINCSYLGKSSKINSALLHLGHFLKVLWSSQLHGNFSFQLYFLVVGFFFSFYPTSSYQEDLSLKIKETEVLQSKI